MQEVERLGHLGADALDQRFSLSHQQPKVGKWHSKAVQSDPSDSQSPDLTVLVRIAFDLKVLLHHPFIALKLDTAEAAESVRRHHRPCKKGDLEHGGENQQCTFPAEVVQSESDLRLLFLVKDLVAERI